MSRSVRTARGLKPETFPFLAVLLCAMGVLILLLLVIDRRAKVVARAKALRAAARLAVDDEVAAALREAEWEQRRQALRATLMRQEQDVLIQRDELQTRAEAAAARLRDERERGDGLRKHTHSEQARLADYERSLSLEREQSARAAQQTEALSAERAAMTGELGKIERTLADLNALRRRQQQTYSLVPYHGKRGDNRKPLYLECAATGLIFHPDRLTLHGPAASDVRTEVERRLAQRSAKEDRPYLLMLVRPDGIATYYCTVAALAGMQLDFGYEFIDADWLLDFPEDDAAPATQPWMMTARKEPGPRSSPSSTPVRRGAPAGISASGGADPRPGQAVEGEPGAQRAPAAMLTPPLRSGAPPGIIPFGGTVPGEPGAAVPGGTAPAPSNVLGEPGTLAPGGTRPAPSPGANASGSPDDRRRTAPAAEDQVAQPGTEPTASSGSSRPGDNRNYVIAVECKADAVVLYPGATRLSLAELTVNAKGEHRLEQVVRQMIARRQAVVRPGEPAYRPQVRFLVRPDGLRAYYRAFPVLEALRVPMTRQNLDQDEELRPDHLGR